MKASEHPFVERSFEGCLEGSHAARRLLMGSFGAPETRRHREGSCAPRRPQVGSWGRLTPCMLVFGICSPPQLFLINSSVASTVCDFAIDSLLTLLPSSKCSCYRWLKLVSVLLADTPFAVGVMRFHTPFAGYACQFSPFHANRVAVATSQNFGIIGNGRQHVLEARAQS